MSEHLGADNPRHSSDSASTAAASDAAPLLHLTAYSSFLGPEQECDPTNLELHPLSRVVPPPSVTDENKIIANIEVRGQLEPVVLYEGRVIDGAIRLRAAKRLGRPLRYRPWIGSATEEEIEQYILSENLERRQLKKSQIALWAGRATMPPASNDGGANLHPCTLSPLSVDMAASAFGVSPRYVQHARRISEALPRSSLLVGRVERGSLKIQPAAEAVELGVISEVAAARDPHRVQSIISEARAARNLPARGEPIMAPRPSTRLFDVLKNLLSDMYDAVRRERGLYDGSLDPLDEAERDDFVANLSAFMNDLNSRDFPIESAQNGVTGAPVDADASPEDGISSSTVSASSTALGPEAAAAAAETEDEPTPGATSPCENTSASMEHIGSNGTGVASFGSPGDRQEFPTTMVSATDSSS